MIELVALDMAGTTVDDGGAVYDALRTAVENTGVAVSPTDLQTWMGVDKVEAITALIELGGGEPRPDRVATAFEDFRSVLARSYRTSPPTPVAGAADAIAALRADGVRVALTTGFTDEVAYGLLDALGWRIGDASEGGLLDAVVTTSDVTAGRPAPYMIFRAMERTDVRDVRAVLAAGDTAVDVRAARNAGAFSVGVLTGKAGRDELERHPHDRVVESVADLPALVRALRDRASASSPDAAALA